MTKITKSSNLSNNKAKKLQFKVARDLKISHVHKESRNKLFDAIKEDQNTNIQHESRINNDENPKHRTFKNTNFSRNHRYLEWGPKINGYQFVATDINDKKEYFKPKALDYLVSSYDWSYMAVPSYNSFQEYLHEKYPDTCPSGQKDNNDETRISNFDEYFKLWEYSFKERGVLLYPVFIGDDISKVNVLRFIESSTLPLNRLLKIERIKWHPDKFSRITKNDQELQLKITEVFQIVNEIYQELAK